MAGGSTGSGNITISKVGNEATVTATGSNAAGIIGCNKGSTCSFSITDCYNAGDITGNNESAAICGWFGTSGTLKNCYNIGSVQGYSYRNDFYRGGASALNCFSTSTTQVTRISSEDVESGKLCYRLNGGVTMDPIWYQTLGEDMHPVFDRDHLVVLKSDADTYYNISNLAGDVNSNGVLDEADAQLIATYLTTGQEPNEFVIINGDANLDSHIDVADVVTVQRLLNDVPLGTQQLTATLYSSNASVKAGGTRKVTIWLNSSRPATAYQADIILSEGLSIQEGSVAFGTKVNTTSHIASVLPLSGGSQGSQIRLVVYAPDNQNLGANSGTALTFTLVGGDNFAGGTYQIAHQCLVTADGVNCNPDDVSYDVSLAKTYVTSITLDPAFLDMVAGDQVTLLATILPETATEKMLSWLTSDTEVATVTDGVVTAVAAGEATITAKATDGSNKQATARVYVYDDATDIPLLSETGDDVTIFTLSGTRLDRITKTGVYIINGQKRFVKVK